MYPNIPWFIIEAQVAAINPPERDPAMVGLTKIPPAGDKSWLQLLLWSEFCSHFWRIRCSSAFLTSLLIYKYWSLHFNISTNKSRWKKNSSRICADFWSEKLLRWIKVQLEMIEWGHRFSQNANQKLLGFLPYPFINFQGRNPGNNLLAFWEKRWPHKFILNLTDLPIGILQIVSEILMQSAQTDGLRILQEFDFGDDKNSDRKSRWLMRVMELPDHLVEIKYWLWMYSLQRYIITLEPFGA